MKADLVVVGAGPAGTAAATEAASCGLDVILVDETSPSSPAPGVRTLPHHLVWTVTPAFHIETIGPAGRVTIEAASLIAATDAIERHRPFPGWTLPGVFGLSAAAALEPAPGQRIVLAGCGPLLATAETHLRAAGADIVAIVTLPGHAVRQATGNGSLQRVQIGPLDPNGHPAGDPHWIEADTLCIGYGLIPAPGIPALLRAHHRFDDRRAAWLPVLDEHGRTSIPGLYAAGGTAGITSPDHAIASGRRTAQAAARDAGKQSHCVEPPPTPAPITPPPGLIEAIPPDTIVCPCEAITRAGIEAAIAAGANEMNQLKHFTRCGMGICQGRICADTVGALLARHLESRTAAGQWTIRPPLSPIPLEALLGTFDYTDIPVPTPAPL
jgi:bacterioferritin-associated ferredoxin